MNGRLAHTAMLQAELTQRKEEGCYVDDVEARVAARGAQASVDELLSFWAEVEGRTPTPYFPYREPSDLESIRCERPAWAAAARPLARAATSYGQGARRVARPRRRAPSRQARRGLAPEPHPKGARARRGVSARRLLPLPGESASRRELPRSAARLVPRRDRPHGPRRRHGLPGPRAEAPGDGRVATSHRRTWRRTG